MNTIALSIEGISDFCHINAVTFVYVTRHLPTEDKSK